METFVLSYFYFSAMKTNNLVAYASTASLAKEGVFRQ